MHRWSLLYAVLKLWFGFIHGLFYRKIIVTGKENIPKGVPLIIAPNHQNALMDPLAVIFTTPLQPVFLARADIFRKAFLRFLLKSIKMLPVYRVRDGIGSVGRNDETFDGTTKILEAKQCVALFPEAQHHGARFLLPLKKGVPRIAFLAEEKNNFNLNIQVVPTGINFSSYGDFRSVLQVNYGKPISVNAFKNAYLESEVTGFNALRNEISERMRPLMIDIQDKAHYDTIDVLRKVYNKPLQQLLKDDNNQRPTWFNTEKEIIRRFDQLDDASRSTLAALSNTLLIQCRNHSVAPEVALDKIPSKGLLFIEKMKLFLLSPLFITGYITGLIPYKLSDIMIGKVKDKQYDSTFRFVISAFSLPLFYALYCVLIATFFKTGWWTLLIFPALFYLGTFALDYRTWVKKIIDQTRMRKFLRQENHALISCRKEMLDFLLNKMQGKKD